MFKKVITAFLIAFMGTCQMSTAQTKVDWKQIKNTPETLDGYGIKDVQRLTALRVYGAVDAWKIKSLKLKPIPYEGIDENGYIYYDIHEQKFKGYENAKWRYLFPDDYTGMTLKLTPQTTAPAPERAKIYYDSVANQYKYYDGAGWKDLGGSGSGKLPTSLPVPFSDGSIYLRTDYHYVTYYDNNQWHRLAERDDTLRKNLSNIDVTLDPTGANRLKSSLGVNDKLSLDFSNFNGALISGDDDTAFKNHFGIGDTLYRGTVAGTIMNATYTTTVTDMVKGHSEIGGTYFAGSEYMNAALEVNTLYGSPNSALFNGDVKILGNLVASSSQKIELRAPQIDVYGDGQYSHGIKLDKVYIKHTNGGGFEAGNISVSGNRTVITSFVLFPLSSAPTSPEAGTMYLDSNSNKIKVYVGSQWKTLAFE